MTLSRFELDALARLEGERNRTAVHDRRMWNYYTCSQRVRHLGMALPPSLQNRGTVIANWCRVAVDATVNRQQIRSVRHLGSTSDDQDIRLIRDASNFSQQLAMFNRDRCVFGRAIMTVFPGPSGSPRIRTESPREMAVEVDEYREVVTGAARFYGTGATLATLYLLGDGEDTPSRTIHCKRDRYGSHWTEVDRDEYSGPLPIFLHLNRRESGSWEGESQLADLIPLADAAARSLTLLGFSQDAHGFPKMVLSGVSAGDFTKPDGTLTPRIEAYFDALTLLKNKDAKAFQLTPADLKNFDTAIDIYGRQASAVTGIPAQMFGIQPRNNPSSEGALRVYEGAHIENIEAQNREVATTIGWVLAYALELTGKTAENNQVQIDWHDPATPTVSQRFDAVVKAKQVGILSTEGAWDELGWPEARKDKEREYRRLEQEDPLMQTVNALIGGNDGAAADDQ